MFNHILLEVYCLKETDENRSKEKPSNCTSSECNPQYSCLANNCPFVSFTSHENALCYVNNKSEAEASVAFGAEDFTDDEMVLWEQISLKKIDEAYNEFASKIPDRKNSKTSTHRTSVTEQPY